MYSTTSCAALMGGGATGVARRLERIGYRVEFWGSSTDTMQTSIRRAGYQYRVLDGLWSVNRDESLPGGDGTSRATSRQPRGVLRKLRARRALRRRLAFDLYRCELSLDRVLHHRASGARDPRRSAAGVLPAALEPQRKGCRTQHAA
jgi:hypothetical protein